jgi:hypothetical protein
VTVDARYRTIKIKAGEHTPWLKLVLTVGADFR